MVRINFRKRLAHFVRHRTKLEMTRKHEYYVKEAKRWVLERSSFIHEENVRLTSYEFWDDERKDFGRESNSTVILRYIRDNDRTDNMIFFIKDEARHNLQHRSPDKWTDVYTIEYEERGTKQRETLVLKRKRCDDILKTYKYAQSYSSSTLEKFRSDEALLGSMNNCNEVALERLIHRDLSYEEISFIFKATEAWAHAVRCQDDGK